MWQESLVIIIVITSLLAQCRFVAPLPQGTANIKIGLIVLYKKRKLRVLVRPISHCLIPITDSAARLN